MSGLDFRQDPTCRTPYYIIYEAPLSFLVRRILEANGEKVTPSDSDITPSTTALLSCPHCGTVLSTSLSVFTKSTKNDREL